jgi:hypothetical protein
MSSYVVQDHVVNHIVGFIRSRAKESLYWDRKLQELGFNHQGWESLAHYLFNLNVKAVDARYGEHEAEKFRALDFHYRPLGATRIQAYKSLKCWAYQCAEGDVPEDAVYRWIVTEVKEHLADLIITALPQYEVATRD